VATVYKVLGQLNPAATTNVTLYTVPASTETVVATMTIATREAANPAKYRIAIRPDGAALGNEHYIVYDAEIYAKTAHALTLGLTINAGDVLTVWAETATITFGAFGVEKTP